MSTHTTRSSDPARHQREVDLFRRALELPPHEREGFLSAECGSDLLLREDVEALLGEDRTGASVSGSFVLDADATEIEALPSDTQIGAYRVAGVLGRGGMGIVYEAEQTSPARRVALKLAHANFASRSAAQRFAFEAEILGRLHHPGIAQIYEAGTAEIDGRARPYFAMELVRGLPITEHAAGARLDVPARLALLRAVCEAVHHAHENGVIHRDLKPANILVDGAGEPRVLDFGVARALQGGSAETHAHTRTGQIVGTLTYMSPEQAAGESGSLGIATDVHALGVVGFELLTGELPYAIRDATLTQALQILAEKEPARLGKLRPSLRGDLEVIFAKALERDPIRRYASARELGEDLRRVLDHEPIVARPASALYHARKFMRRHRGLSAGLALAALALVAGTAVSIAWALRAEEAREQAGAAERRALEDARIATSVTDFVRELFDGASPKVALGEELSAFEIVERGRQKLLSGSVSEPAVRSRLMLFVGGVLLELGRYEEAEPLMKEALAILEATVPAGDPRHLDALHGLGVLHFEAARPTEAQPFFERELALIEAQERPLLRHRARCHEAFSSLAIKTGAPVLALHHATELLRLHREIGEPVLVAKALQRVAMAHVLLRDLERADEHYQLALESLAECEAPLVEMEIATNLGTLRMEQRNAVEAERLFRRALEAGEKVFPADHPVIMRRLCNLGGALAMTRRVEEARPLLERAYAIGSRRDTSRDESFSNVCGMLGNIHGLEERFDLALPYWERALAILENLMGRENALLVPTLENLLLAYDALGKEDSSRTTRERIERLRK